MRSHILNFLKTNWKYIVCCLAPLAIVAIIFALPIKTIAIQVEENYWDTELKQYAYTAAESFEVLEPLTTEVIRSETVYDSVVPTADGSYSFKVKAPDTLVDINWQDYYYGYPWVLRWNSYNSSEPDPYRYFIPNNYYWGNARLTIKITYPESITTYNKVTKSKDVTRYIDVPTPVLKTKTLTEYKKISIWSYLFR